MELNKIIQSIQTCIVKPRSKVLIVSPDDYSRKEAYDMTKQILLEGNRLINGNVSKYGDNIIKFRNESLIEFAIPREPDDIIKSRRLTDNESFLLYEPIIYDVNTVLDMVVVADKTD